MTVLFDTGNARGHLREQVAVGIEHSVSFERVIHGKSHYEVCATRAIAAQYLALVVARPTERR